jgi:hypothetical protein
MSADDAQGELFWCDWMVRGCAAAVCTDLGRRDVARALREMPAVVDDDAVAATRGKLQDLLAIVSHDRSVGARAGGMLMVVAAGLLTWEARSSNNSTSGATVAYEIARRAALFAEGLGVNRSDIVLVASSAVPLQTTSLN